MLDRISELDPETIRTLFATDGEFRRHQSGGDYLSDFHADLRRARETGPVHEGTLEEVLGLPRSAAAGLRFDREFTAFDFETVNSVFRRPDLFSSELMAGTNRMFGRNLLPMNGREHFHHRAAAAPTFARSTTQWWIDNWIGSITDSLLDGIEGRGAAELNLELCALLPLLTITSSFGVPIDEALRLRLLIEKMISPTFTVEERLAGSAEAADILRPIIAERRADPRDDVLSRLLAETVKDDSGAEVRLTDEDVLGYGRLLLTAGSGTTWRQLGITLWALLNHPEQLQAVRSDRSLVRNAIEESLRFEVTDPTFFRLATQDTELAGVAVPAGARVALCLTGANHDPARWPDPDTFDIHRPLRPHLSFAGGPHVCLGMHVARAELTTALNAVLDRLPNLRWDPAVERPALMGVHHRAPQSLPVVFG